MNGKHEAILHFLRVHSAVYGVCASAMEIGEALDLPLSTVLHALRVLEERGYLERAGTGHRALRVTRLPAGNQSIPVDRAESVALRAQGRAAPDSWLSLSRELFPDAVAAVRVGDDSLPEEYISEGDVMIMARGAADFGEPFLSGRGPLEKLALRSRRGTESGLKLLAVVKYY